MRSNSAMYLDCSSSSRNIYELRKRLLKGLLNHLAQVVYNLLPAHEQALAPAQPL